MKQDWCCANTRQTLPAALHTNQPYGTNMTAAHNQSKAKNRSAECDVDPPTLILYACGSAVDGNKPEAIMAEEACREAASDGRRGWADGRALGRGRPLSHTGSAAGGHTLPPTGRRAIP